MSNAITQLCLAGLLMIPPFCDSDPHGGPSVKKAFSTPAAAHCNPGGLPVVAIYLNERINVNLYRRWRAIFIATRVFRKIGVDLEWRAGAVPPEPDPSGCAAEIIELEVDQTAVPTNSLEALGYATPMRASGTRIHVFNDRVTEISEHVPNVLGYVLAHEIGHVLQGVARHSGEGILKAKWNGRDYNLMGTIALGFSHEDVERIRNHLDRQQSATD